MPPWHPYLFLFLSTHSHASCAQSAAANVLAANAGLPIVCIMNAGSIRTDISAGNVTLAQVNTILPFGST